MLSNVTPIRYVRHSHNKGIVVIQNIYIYKKSHLGRTLIQNIVILDCKIYTIFHMSFNKVTYLLQSHSRTLRIIISKNYIITMYNFYVSKFKH